VSYSWVDPTFVAQYRRRDDVRQLERLEQRLRARERHVDLLEGVTWKDAGWVEQGLVLRYPRGF
jgi:hypothetical protein